MYVKHYRSRSTSRDLSMSDKSSDCASEYRRRSRSRSLSHETEYRLHVADIGEGVKKRDMERLFEEFGELKEIWMANSPPCFGFAVFKHKTNAINALKATDGMYMVTGDHLKVFTFSLLLRMLCGGRIRVTHAKPRTRGLGRRYYNPNMRCYECGTSGHFYRDCPDLNDKYGSSKHSRRSSHHYYPRSRRSHDRRERRYSENRSPEDRRRRR